ncbi:hypothetical protein ACFWII_21165 [Streptomyces sp. NPDC127063]|uniref:hypothetical protein n=1 Tax=Streptomyces sp. NPDC127063 TaxID=3347123 RepID=UPI003669E1AC
MLDVRDSFYPKRLIGVTKAGIDFIGSASSIGTVWIDGHHADLCATLDSLPHAPLEIKLLRAVRIEPKQFIIPGKAIEELLII